MRIAAVLAIGAAVVGSALPQTVHVPKNHVSVDPYADVYRSGKYIHFSGRVTGFSTIQPMQGGEHNVTLLVRNNEGGGTATVEMGPDWYVSHQEAKIHLKDRVEVTGRKVTLGGQGVIVAEMIVVNRPTGLVLTLRAPSGHAYWLGPEVAAKLPTEPNMVGGTINGFQTYTVDNVPYEAAVLQTSNGLVTVDLGPTWYYGRQNLSYHVGDYLNVVEGANPLYVGPNSAIVSPYAVYSGSSVYWMRNAQGVPYYNWYRQ